jgi:hypothetical protein
MKIFRSGKGESNASPPKRRKTDVGGRPARASHRLTVDLARAERLAAMIARSRAAKFIEVADLLAGMYIYEWERLSRFWDDHEEIEDFLRSICNISPQRWNYWIENYDKERHLHEGDPVSAGRKLKNERAGDALLERSSELQKIFTWAEEIAPFREDDGRRKIPVLTMECVLLCIARNPQSEISRKLRETALDLGGLERAARDPRRAPSR